MNRSKPNEIAVIVLDYLPALGGTTTQARLQALELLRRGWHVTILTRRMNFSNSQESIESLPIRRFGLPYQGHFAKASAIIGMWWWIVRRRRSLSAVHVIMDPDFVLCAWGAGLGRFTILTWASLGDPRRALTGRKGRFRSRILRTCQHVVLTHEMQQELETVLRSNTEVIPVPVDLIRFRPPSNGQRESARRSLGIRGERAVVFVGHIRKQKGVARLVEAILLLRERRWDVVLFIVGSPLERADHKYLKGMKDYVKEHNLSDSVRFLGAHGDVRPFLHAGDVFCLPSDREGMPNVLLEAMASGLVCIAPPSAGGTELLGHGAGCVPPSNSPADLATAIEDLFEHPENGASMRHTALNRVLRLNSVEHVVDLYEGILSHMDRERRRTAILR